MFTLFWSEVSPPTIDVKHDVCTLSWSEVSPPITNKSREFSLDDQRVRKRIPFGLQPATSDQL